MDRGESGRSNMENENNFELKRAIHWNKKGTLFWKSGQVQSERLRIEVSCQSIS